MPLDDHPNIVATRALDREADDFEQEYVDPLELVGADQTIREKIEHLLRIYPRISQMMLQVGIGPSISPDMWRPVLQQMTDAEVVKQRSESLRHPNGRTYIHKIIELGPMSEFKPFEFVTKP